MKINFGSKQKVLLSSYQKQQTKVIFSSKGSDF